MRIDREDFRLIKSMRFEFAKVIVNPAPLQSGGHLDASRVGYLDRILAAAAAERLPVVVCIHPEPEFKIAALGGSAEFDRFEAFVGELAHHLARRGTPKQLALQLMTEPFGGGSSPDDWNWWDRLQHRLWRTARAAMPGYTLILSGDKVGRIEGLDDITPVKDDRVLYSFTFYEPSVFTQQGGPWLPGGMRYLKGLPFPSGPDTPGAMEKVVSEAPAQWRADIQARVEQYAAERWDEARLAASIARAVEWRRRHPGTRLWCAEFGCYEAAPPADRLRYLAAVSRLLGENGIGWAYWSYNETFTVMTRDRVPFGPASRQKPDRALLRALFAPLRNGRSVALAGARSDPGFVVTDRFGRDVTKRGLTLVDWEGQIANPAIRFYVRAPAGARLPARATLSANGSRLYFDLPSETGEDGPRKTLTFSDPAKPVPVLMSVFPDRDGLDEDATLTLRLEGSAVTTRVPIHVVDQDRPGRSTFRVVVDYSQDRTGFFDDPRKRAIVQQAADDWGFFFQPMHLDAVPARAQSVWIWNPDGFVSGREVRNSTAYTGFLLYAYGIAGPEMRSGGEASAEGFQTSQGAPLALRRAGGFAAEIDGNYNTLGWFLTEGDEDWAHTGNLRKEACDFYSIAHHEIGHALVFHDAHTVFGRAKTAGQLADGGLVGYLGAAPKIDRFCHLPGAVDPASRRGAFGNEYFGDMPRKRWLITKTDLFVARAVGYRLRRTSAFVPLAFAAPALPRGSPGAAYAARLVAAGGIPSYCWEVVSGRLPPGLALDSFSGRIAGAPTAAGSFSCTIRVRDQDETGPGVSRCVSVVVAKRPGRHTLRRRTLNR